MSRLWTVLVNEAAGTTPTPPGFVSETLRALGVEHVIVTPVSALEARAAIRESIGAGRTNIAVVGGDGSLSMAVDEIVSLGQDVTVAVLPAGTGCDLIRTFGIPQKLGAAAKHLTTDDSYLIDVVALEGAWGSRYFVNVAQAGVGAAAVQSASRLSRRFGSARYPMAFAARLPRFPRAQVTVTTERRTYESEALAVIAANGQFFAGGWNVAPRATLMDGVVDIQVINARKTQAPALVPKVIKGTHLPDPAVRRFTAAEFTIESDVIWPVEADGDLVGNTPVKGRVVPAAIRLKI